MARSAGRTKSGRSYARTGAGEEFTQEPVERYGNVDASFRDPSGNGWKLVQERR